MAFDPERFGAAVKDLIDRRLGELEARIAALEGGTKSVHKALTEYEPTRGYQMNETAIIASEGSIWRAKRFTRGLPHPRHSPASWERVQ